MFVSLHCITFPRIGESAESPVQSEQAMNLLPEVRGAGLRKAAVDVINTSAGQKSVSRVCFCLSIGMIKHTFTDQRFVQVPLSGRT